MSLIGPIRRGKLAVYYHLYTYFLLTLLFEFYTPMNTGLLLS